MIVSRSSNGIHEILANTFGVSFLELVFSRMAATHGDK